MNYVKNKVFIVRSVLVTEFLVPVITHEMEANIKPRSLKIVV